MPYDDFESFWNTIRPQRGQTLDRPDQNPCAEIPLGTHELPRGHRLGSGFDHDAAIRNLELPGNWSRHEDRFQRSFDEARRRVEQQLGHTLESQEVAQLYDNGTFVPDLVGTQGDQHVTLDLNMYAENLMGRPLTAREQSLVARGIDHTLRPTVRTNIDLNGSIALETPHDEDLFVPDYEGPQGNMAPRSHLESMALQMAARRVTDLSRRLPRTTTAAALLARIPDELGPRLAQYSRRPGATLEGLDAFIGHELEPLEALASGAVVIPDLEGESPAVQEGMERLAQLSDEMNLSPVAQSIRRNLRTGLTTEELLTRVLNEVSPPTQEHNPMEPTLEEAREFVQQGFQDNPSPVVRAIEQENRVQALLDRVVFTDTNFATTWMNPNEGPPQLVALVRAFRDLGLAVDTHLQLGDEPGDSTLTLVIDDQTIRLECEGGRVRVRVFEPLGEITSL